MRQLTEQRQPQRQRQPRKITTLQFDPKKLRKAREAKGLGLSQAAGEVGVHKQSLHQYEQGTNAPPDVLLRLMVLYETDLRDLSKRAA